jgi:hypothetical protein
MRVSYTYHRLITHIGYMSSIKSEMYPPYVALINILVNTSTSRLKGKGDKGSPYVKPFAGLKYELFSSLILMEIAP